MGGIAVLRTLPLLERDAERAEAARLLTQAREGQGTLLLLGGEAGIGKTTLLEAMAGDANGMLCVVGHCPGPGDAPPFGPLHQVVGQLAARHGADSETLPAPLGLAQTGAREGENPALLAGALAGWLGAVGQPVLAALEDVHWADPSTLEVLKHLPGHLAGLPVLVVATYRTDEVNRTHPLWALLPHWQRFGCPRLLLRRLTPRAVAELAAHALGERPDLDGLANRLYQRTGGLPLFVREMLHALSQREAPNDESLPETVQQVIDSLLSRLAAGTQEVLQVAAVIGEHFEWDLLERVLNLGEEQLQAAVEEAVAYHVVRPAGGERYRFGHALVREALLARLHGPRRRRWLRRVAGPTEGFQRTYGVGMHLDGLTGRESDVARLVAQGLSDKEVAARLSISHRTVDGHLRNIYSKLRIGSRASLTAWVIRQGMVQE